MGHPGWGDIALGIIAGILLYLLITQGGIA